MSNVALKTNTCYMLKKSFLIFTKKILQFELLMYFEMVHFLNDYIEKIP